MVEGDANPSFFHKTIIVCQRKSWLISLYKGDGTKVESKAEILAMVWKHFQDSWNLPTPNTKLQLS